ncbi:MAG: class I SAM-dependent methyltransferase, partial [Gemmatimonadales bacterium]
MARLDWFGDPSDGLASKDLADEAERGIGRCGARPQAVGSDSAAIEGSLHGTRQLIREVSDIAPGYARTLRAWRTRFMGQLDAVRGQGFDERFIRMWEYYL